MKSFYKILLGMALCTALLISYIRQADGSNSPAQNRNSTGDEFIILPIRIESHDPATGKFCSPYFILRFHENGRHDLLFRLPNTPATLLVGFAKNNIVVDIDELHKRPTAKRSPYRGNIVIISMNQETYQQSKECLPFPRSFI